MTDHRLHKCIFFALCSIMFVACSSGPDGPTPIINDITDSDSDGIPDTTDSCDFTTNPELADSDDDGIGDACETINPDLDDDSIANDLDNCPTIANPLQENTDGDRLGDACDPTVAGTIPQAVVANLELVADKTFRISWQAAEGAQTYKILENPDGNSGFADISGELEADSTNFDHRVALYARVNAQYMVEACNAAGCAPSDPLIVTGALDSAIGYFKASNTDAFDSFGHVSLSVDGNTLAVGAERERSAAIGINGDQNDNSADLAGAVYVFVRNGGLWRQQAYLKASNTGNDDRFGLAVSLSANGSTLAVGALEEKSAARGINGDQNDNSALQSGAVYIFAHSGGLWQQQAYLKASNTDAVDGFGLTVSVNADGNTLVVGAQNEGSAATGINGDQNDNSAFGAGAAYVY